MSKRKTVCLRIDHEGIAVQTMSEHVLPGYQGPRGLLIGYGAIHEHALARAAHELAVAVEGSAQSTDKPEGLAHVA